MTVKFWGLDILLPYLKRLSFFELGYSVPKAYSVGFTANGSDSRVLCLKLRAYRV